MSKVISVLLVVVIVACAAAFLYPTVSDQLNRYQNAQRIYSYKATARNLEPADYNRMLAEARDYNAGLKGMSFRDIFTGITATFSENPAKSVLYRSLIDPSGDGVMGVLEIPKIGVRLAIYHGTDEDVLEKGIGHMEGTALPVGGLGTHCGLSGHRGLPSARLLSDLDQMEVGDLFYIVVLGELLVYQVDQVNVVLPHELEYMDADPLMDLVTLVTCTPYAVNSHRLLVRGSRVAPENVYDALSTAPAVESAPSWKSAVICAVPFAAVFFLVLRVTAVATRGRFKRELMNQTTKRMRL